MDCFVPVFVSYVVSVYPQSAAIFSYFDFYGPPRDSLCFSTRNNNSRHKRDQTISRLPFFSSIELYKKLGYRHKMDAFFTLAGMVKKLPAEQLSFSLLSWVAV